MSQLVARPLPAARRGLALAVLAALALLFAVAFDQGQLAGVVGLAQAAVGDSTVHEFFHDTRHMLGVPCH